MKRRYFSFVDSEETHKFQEVMNLNEMMRLKKLAQSQIYMGKKRRKPKDFETNRSSGSDSRYNRAC